MLSVAGMGARSLLVGDARCTDEGIGHGRLTAFEPETGAQRWSRRANGVATKTDFWGNSSTVDVGAGGVVITPGGRFGPDIVALDERDGRRRWSVHGEAILGVSTADVFSATAGAPRSLVARDRRSGRRRWAFAGGSPGWERTFDVVAADPEVVVVASGDYLSRIGEQPASATTFTVLDARTGRARNSFTAADPSIHFSDILLAYGALVYGERGSIVARDLTTAAVRWTKEFPEATYVGGGVASVLLHATPSADRVFVSETVGETPRVVALDTQTGAVVWDRPDSFVGAGGPAVSAFSDGANGLAGVATATGTTRWRSSVLRRVTGRYGSGSVGLAAGRLAVSQTCDTG
jgi:outer membrane protein assembly factor BamB